MALRIVHAADFHLDSAFAALSPEQQRLRRRESRTLPERLAAYVNERGADLVLLAGDLFDGADVYRETLEALAAALGSMRARVFIAPGNHDFYSSRSPYALIDWPENVHIFRRREIEGVTIAELGCTVYGAAFTGESQAESLFSHFCAPQDGLLHVGVLHADVGAADSKYDPVTCGEIAASGLDYLALGHAHSFSGIEHAGRTAYAYAGCPEGRGFDEAGDKGFLSGTLMRSGVQMEFIPLARRRYEILHVDVTGKDPLEALRLALPSDGAENLYRVILTGETDERGVNTAALRERFASQFFYFELRDETRIGEAIWARAAEDSLRGEFLRILRADYEAAQSEDERATVERAVRFGLAALDHRDW